MACSDPPPPPLEGLREGSEIVADLFTLACYGVFSILIGLDAWRAYSKRAIWLPGKTFALTGVTVQIIAWWTSVTGGFTGYDTGSLIFTQQLYVSGRVGVCVFLGYLLPQMAAPSVRTYVALAITLCAQVVSELLIFCKKQSDLWKEINMDYEELPTNWSKNWSIIVDFVVPICVIVLGLILGCTTLASKTINDLLKQRISAISPITEEDEFQFTHEWTKSISWNDFEDEVLRSWFVARVCRVDYVISRSAFSSAVGIVVTISVIICLLSNTLHNTYFGLYHDPIAISYSSALSLLFSFIIIGWVVICWRWLAASLYFGQHRHCWRKSLFVEDYWTSNIVELIHVYELKRDRQQFLRSNPEMSLLSKLKSFPITIFTKIRLYKLLYLVLTIQLAVIFFSKLCGLLSEVIVGKFLYWCHKHTTKGVSTKAPEKYAEILECLCMPGEDPSALWEANRMSYDNVKLLMKKSCEKGISSREINSLFCQYALQWAADGKQLLNMLQKIAISSISKRFSSVEKSCVKMTVVSLIKIFFRLHEAKSDRLTKLVKACTEVWDLLSFVDECDIDLQVDAIVLLDDLNRDKDQVHMAADSEFYKLQMSYDRLQFGCSEGALRCLENLLEESEELLKKEKLQDNCKEEVIADMNDSKDWMKIAPSYSLYKLCKLMLNGNIEDFVEWTEISLRNVIAFSMSRLPDVLVKQCWKWAKDFEEDKLWGAIHLAGKCKGMMEAWGLEPQSTFSTTKQQRIQVVLSSQSPC